MLFNLRRLIVLSIVVLASYATLVSAAQGNDVSKVSCREKSHQSTTPLISWASCVRQETQTILSDKCRPQYKLRYVPLGTSPVGIRKYLVIQWIERRTKAKELSSRCIQVLIPHYSQWLCIHSHEGAWNANTGNGYYGGLQMDISFQRTYGPELLRAKGTADNWTPFEQMMVAERAHRSGRGFGPWPNTARMCGLL